MRTGGKQRYIFASGKRQEIVGASHLIRSVTESWIDQALGEVFSGFSRSWRVSEHPAELVVAAAGGATVLVRGDDESKAREVVTALTVKALHDAPGLDVAAVVHRYEDGEERGLVKALEDARAAFGAARAATPGPQARFLRLPLVEDCASSGLPAARLIQEGEEGPRPRSTVGIAKLAAYPEALARWARITETTESAMRQLVERLGFHSSWVGVVHADGNGLGEVVSKVSESYKDSDADHANGLRTFSTAVNQCAERAFQRAHSRTVDELGYEAGKPYVLPLVLGGDDLTVVCEGEVALPFTRYYLEEFEKETAEHEQLKGMLAAVGRRYLTAGAGVAVVKRNYPFHFAYDLAEELATDEAKSVKQHGSALAFSVLYESSAPELRRIRTAAGGARSASPYAVGMNQGGEWANGRRFEDLVSAVRALVATDEASGELLVSRSAVHDLREGVHLGEDVANARFELLSHRYVGDAQRTEALGDLAGPQGLFWDDPLAEGSRRVTRLLDALAALPFMPEGEGTR
ncbi:Cas10/Cmr2 second palm domain-containing protein [Sinosporangium album]|uniref:Cas10/Cmr2 second palm domain-containing protein n=1 Tax=Sinosporangium album TaxID=504805 RepID=UPI00115FF678|nr:hypothetical protein [Sinosporangium album]